jgi:DNA polymerase-3 subunit beta
MITINKSALKAVSRFAAKSDIRYYLVGVYVEANETETRLIATDGHAMLVHRMFAENTHAWAGIIPLDTVTAILKHKTASKKVDFPIELSECGDTEGRIDYAGQAFIFKPVDGKFPDYRRVIPKDITGEAACYQPEYLQRVYDAAVDLGAVDHKIGRFGMGYNGNSSAVCPINDDCLAIVMPLRQDMLPAGAVGFDWAREPVAPASVKLQSVA